MLRAPRRPGSPAPFLDVPAQPEADALADPAPVVELEAAAPLGTELDGIEFVGDEPGPSAPPAPGVEPRPTAPARPVVHSWQPARQGSRDRAPARGAVEVDPQAEPAGSPVPAIERVATAPQLRRFIKSRAYVPMHELRRRFAINGGDDDVTPVELDRSRVYVGLPEREGRLLGELLRGGDIGYELSLDPISPIVVGVYPMRPVTRG